MRALCEVHNVNYNTTVVTWSVLGVGGRVDYVER